MAKANDNSDEKTAAADLGRVDDAVADASSTAANPLMSSFAAATAIGFHFASQMAGAMLGSFQGALDATTKLARTLEEERKAAATKSPEPANEVAPQETSAEAPPVVPAPAVETPLKDVDAKAKTQKPAAPKVKTTAAKPVVAEKPLTEKKPAKTAAPRAKATAEKADVVEVPAAVDQKPAKATTRKKAAKSDDLKRISGIGPKVEQVLNGLGVTRYAEIAAWTADDIARFDTELGFAGRIGRDDWVGQAKALMGGKA